ncbi:MAG: pentapeptide repeat-containing protein [Thermoanaerobaculales bacterium]|jgi:hypothetical protein|nr:pentapeptide repeat-containing protein [Thermoanaerobaculales bacterium]
MPETIHLEILEQGSEDWNRWRRGNPGVRPVFKNEDLSELDLTRVNLSEADLSYTELFDATLTHANLKMAVMSGSDLSGAKLDGAELYKVDLTDASLIGADFSDCYLAEANLRGADLRGVNLQGADLSGADLRGANLAGANLGRTTLARADITGANLRNADIYGADLTDMEYGSYPSMRGHFYGIRGLPSCYGNALFVRDAKDQDYLDTMENTIEATPSTAMRRWKRFWFRAWGLIDYGRSLARFFAIAFVVAMTFGWVYFFDRKLGWGLIEYSGSADSPLSPFYHSIVTYTKLGFGNMTPRHWLGEILLVGEGILGYVTLGLLLSILANRVARRS